MAIESWSKAAGSNNATPPDGFPEGMAPGSVNDSAREVMAQVRRWAEQAVSGTTASDTGSANTYVIAPAIAPSAYTTGAIYWFKAVNANSGASTLNVSVLGAKTIKKFTGSGVADLAAGDILANQLVAVVYDGTNMVMISPVAGLAQTTVANTFTADQTIVSTDAGAAVGPRLILDRDSASPAANDVIGGVDFQGNDSGASNETYARIQGIILDPTAASEDSQVTILTENAGALAARITVGQGLQIGSPTGGDPGAGKLNASALQMAGQEINGVATQSEMEAASDTAKVVTPGRAHFHPGVAKAWVNFAFGGTTINLDYGVASLTNNGTGDTTITLDTAFSTSNFAWAGSAQQNTTGANNQTFLSEQARTASTLRVRAAIGGDNGQSSAFVSPNPACVAFYGDL